MSGANGSARPRRRVVVTSTFPIHPRVFGGQHRVLHTARQLATVADVTVVSLTDHGAGSAVHELGAGVREHTVEKSAAHAAVDAEVGAGASAAVGDIVSAFATDETPAYREALDAAMADADAVLLAHPYLLPSVRGTGRRLPLLYDAHNAEWRHKQAALPESPERSRLLDLVRAVEADACREALVVSATGARDADALREDYGIAADRLVVVPNGADVESVAFTGGTDRRRHTRRWLASLAEMRGDEPPDALAVFVGSNHRPSAEAARAVATMAASRPDVVFVVAGGAGEALADVDAPANLLVAGWVTDVVKRVLLQSATVALNPITSGYGSNVKVPEYLAAGVPVVTTPLGGRGIELTDGVDAMIRDVEDFDAAIAEVQRHATTADALAVAGRRLVEDRYSWAAATAAWRERVVAALA